MNNIPNRIRYLGTERADSLWCTLIANGRDEEITYGELYDRCRAYARYYLSAGVSRGDVVLVILRHTPHLFYSFLGAMLIGAVPSFMPFPSPKQRPELYWSDREALFRRIEPRLIVTYEENATSARQALARFPISICLASDSIVEAQGVNRDFAGFDAQPHDIACLQHSSGTTGLKKGVMLTHQMLFEHHKAYSKAIGFGDGDSIASWLPLYHDMGFIACFMGSLLQGTHLVAIDPFEWVMRPRILLDAIEKYRSTFCWLPNFAFSHLVNTARSNSTSDLSSVRAFVNCSEPCKPATFDRFLDRFKESGVSAKSLQVCYAMAENVFGVTQTRIGEPAAVIDVDVEDLSRGSFTPAKEDRASQGLLSCGAAISGVQLRIRDGETQQDLPEDRVGEILVSSPYLFGGYYQLPEKTAERLHDGWYATGDVGFLHEGELYVTGRIDDMLIINGRNYYAHEIEALAAEVDGIAPGRSVAIGIEDKGSDATVVVLLAECLDDADLTELSSYVKRRVLERTGLALHAFIPIASGTLVKTTSGKLSRTKNKELYLRGVFDGGALRDG